MPDCVLCAVGGVCVIDPFKIDGPTCISFSGGRTSAYMLWRVLQSNGGLPPEAIVCFANTGKEEEATLQFVRDCEKHWGIIISWVEYRDTDKGYVEVEFNSASRKGEPFSAIIDARMRGQSGLPNGVSRYCSSELKTRTMHRYLRQVGFQEWDTFIGIRADEPRRVAKFRANAHPESKHETICVPLADVGVSAHDVADFWRLMPFDLELPNMNGKTMHGNCDLCFLKPGAQLLSLIQEKPSRAIWWAEQETKAKTAGKGLTGSRFRIDIPTYSDMAAFTSNQSDMFSSDEEAIPCFCGD